MKASKKKKKGVRLAKLRNGGITGDPKNTGELLSMLDNFGSPKTQPLELSDNTQPFGYTPPRLSEEGIDVIPKTLTNQELFGAISQNYEGQNPNAAWMYGAMNNMPPSVAQKWRDENPGTSPEGVNMIGVLGAAGYASLGVVLPGTSQVGGVTIGDALNAYFLKEGVEGGIKHIPEFANDPSLEGARNIAWDAIYAFPGMKALTNNILKPFLDGYKNARKASAPVSMGTKDLAWDEAAQAFTTTGETRHLDGFADNIKAFVQSPVIEGLSKPAINISELITAAITAAKELTAGSSTAIKLFDASSATESALNVGQISSQLSSQLYETIDLYEGFVKDKLLTEAEKQNSIARAIAYKQEKSKMPGFIAHISESMRLAYSDPSQMSSLERSYLGKHGIQQFGYPQADPNDPDHFDWVTYDDPQTATLKMYEMLTSPESDGVLRRAVSNTQEQLGEKARESGDAIPPELAGLYQSSNAVDQMEPFTLATISYLNTLPPDKLIQTLAHENNHALRKYFMPYLMDNWAIESFTLIDDIRRNESAFENEVGAGHIKSGSDLEAVGRSQALRGRHSQWEKSTKYYLKPVEVLARLEEIQIAWWETAEGANMSDWAYKWTPELAMKAFDNWNPTHPLISLMKGTNEKDRFASLSALLNNTLAPAAALVAGSQTLDNEAVADPAIGSRQYKQGGFIAKKFRPRGMNLRKSN